MAVQSVCPIAESNSLSTTLPYTEEIVAAWKVVGEQNDEVLVIRAQAQAPPYNLPKLNDLYQRTGESSVRSRAQRIRVTRMGAPVKERSAWRYEVTYGNKNGQGNKEPPPGDPLPGDENPDPTQRPIRYWMEWQQFQERVDVDTNGIQVTNSANHQFLSPPVTRDNSRQVLVIQKNWEANDWNAFKSLLDQAKAIKLKTNSVVWWGNDPDHVIMLPPALQGPRFENDKVFYEMVYRAVIFDNPNEGPLFAPLDLGTAELVKIREGQGDERTVNRELTDGLNTHTGTVKLDGYGKIMADQSQPAVALDGLGGPPARKGPFRLNAQVDLNTYLPTPT